MRLKPQKSHQLQPLRTPLTFIEKCNSEMEIYFEKIYSQTLVEQVE